MMKFLKEKGIYLLAGLLIFFYAFSKQGQKLEAKGFSQKIKETPDAQIIDVRTPEEFSGGYIPGAVNINWNDDRFEAQAAKLDKHKPIFVYCLSGGRSSSAGRKLRAMGYDPVYELNGGMMSWRAFGLPETKGKTKNAGMSQKEFDSLLEDERLVLVDFYASWCAPCKKMAPYLEEISKGMASKVKVVRIDADKHPGLSNDLKVSALPTLFIYKNKKKLWSHTGYIAKDDMIRELKKR